MIIEKCISEADIMAKMELLEKQKQNIEGKKNELEKMADTVAKRVEKKPG